MTHIAAGLFFALVLVGAAAILHLTIREHLSEILAALVGEVPARRSRPWGRRVKVTVRRDPASARVMLPQRAAA
ncbi:MAG: hypothetical protein JWN69_1385 [Alphaproteobacteria bacterium]|nr:hypothetical protein [Alphaproteobacteria bacterium]